MNVNYNLDTLNPNRFMERLAERQARVKQASAEPLPKDYAVNALARALHPQRQFLKVAAVTELEKDCKCYRLEADPARGDLSLCLFCRRAVSDGLPEYGWDAHKPGLFHFFLSQGGTGRLLHADHQVCGGRPGLPVYPGHLGGGYTGRSLRPGGHL